MRIVGVFCIVFGALVALTPNTDGDFVAGAMMVVAGCLLRFSGSRLKLATREPE